MFSEAFVVFSSVFMIGKEVINLKGFPVFFSFGEVKNPSKMSYLGCGQEMVIFRLKLRKKGIVATSKQKGEKKRDLIGLQN